MLIWRTWNHAKPLTRLRNSSSATIRSFSDGSTKTKGQSRLLRNKPIWALLISGAAVYTYYEYVRKEPGQHGSFQRYSIVEKNACSSTSSIFRLRPQQSPSSNNQKQGLWSVEIKQPQLQIAREYTPIPSPLADQPSNDLSLPHGQRDLEVLEFWIRREPHGEVSNYLHNLELNDTVELRGPKSETSIPDAQEILFVAGGTGIAPAIQLAHLLLARQSETNPLPRLSILWANRKSEDCLGGVSDSGFQTSLGFFGRLFSKASTTPVDSEKTYIVQRLDALKKAFNGNMQVDYYVDEENSRISKRDVLSYIETRDDNKVSTSKRVVMVCGPDGFVAHFAGPKAWSNGRQVQGKVAGVLQDAERLGWDVIKL